MIETRYVYSLPHRDEAQLHAEIAAQALALSGFVGVCGSGAECSILFAGVLSAEQHTILGALVAAHVPRTGEERTTAATLDAIRTADDPVSRGTRATITLLFTMVNDLREQAGLPRYTEPEILAAIAVSTQQGAGEPR